MTEYLVVIPEDQLAIEYLQAELDIRCNGKLIVYPSVGTNGVDLYNQFGYVATYNDCNEVRNEVGDKDDGSQ
tara:strand:- start:7256 stop:7471 length:216 start_codon:yes stop_codon:yes gene_type:complete